MNPIDYKHKREKQLPALEKAFSHKRGKPKKKSWQIIGLWLKGAKLPDWTDKYDFGPPPYGAMKYSKKESALEAWNNYVRKGEISKQAEYWLVNLETGERINLKSS